MSDGLSKRELIAAMAMQGILAAEPEGAHYSASGCAKTSVNFADALIEELNKIETEETSPAASGEFPPPKILLDQKGAQVPRHDLHEIIYSKADGGCTTNGYHWYRDLNGDIHISEKGLIKR